ncbi:MAG: TetR/AcrR family transcriptional regulator [Rhizobiales bacterium]|nr:TetR/AcrR family transcriptional regulator [Hyphomicrobiales bacterium]
MTGKRAAVREDLTRRLLEAATVRIERHGLAGLRARDITGDAGCGLGTIYKCYADLDDLILKVNSCTLARLDQALAQATRGLEDPRDQLQAMAQGYVEFATGNLNLWSALFDHRMPEGTPTPQWHRAEQEAMFALVERPLAALSPELGEDRLAARARSVFAAVHGIVALSLEGRFVGVKEADLRAELEVVVGALVRGLA